MNKLSIGLFGYILLTLLTPQNFLAQAQEPKPVKVWTGNFGAGFAATSGNTDTTNINISVGLVRDPKKKAVTRTSILYLRGDRDGEIILNRTTISGREEINIAPRVFVFSQMDYIRDTFKSIDYIASPTVGIGLKIVNSDRTLFAIDNGIGGVWERDLNQPTKGSGAYNAGERLSCKLTKTATFTHSLSSLWKTNDWGDSLQNFTAGVGVSVSAHLELKLEFLDTYKNRPPLVTLKKNDTSTVTALVVKF